MPCCLHSCSGRPRRALAPATADPQYFRYQRTITVAGGPGQSCAVIDPQIFPHAAPSLKDLRLYQDGREVPYAITLSEPAAARQRHRTRPQPRPSRSQHRLRPGDAQPPLYGGHARPRRPGLSRHGHGLRHARPQLFESDQSRRVHTLRPHLAAPLPQYNASPAGDQPSLPAHRTDRLAGNRQPQLHRNAARWSQAPPFRPAARPSRSIPPPPQPPTSRNAAVRASLPSALPERIPVERVSFDLAPTIKRTSAAMSASPTARRAAPALGAKASPAPFFACTLPRRAARFVSSNSAFPRPSARTCKAPRPLRSRSTMATTRRFPSPPSGSRCASARSASTPPTAQPLTLFYGDPALTAPQYDYARLFSPSAAMRTAQLGPEQLNPAYRDRPDTRPLTERHPHLLWIVLLVVICILAIVAIRSSKTVHH